ncbi:MAG: hypothetical protein ACKVQJ_04395 [Pyrinomonadaceae bacterium]
MAVADEQYVVDGAGNRSAVLVGVDRYFKLIEAEEELECIRAFDAAKSSDNEVIPFLQAVEEIEEIRK